MRVIFEFELDADPAGDRVRSSALPEVKGNDQWQENESMDRIQIEEGGALSSLEQTASELLDCVRASPKRTLSSPSFRSKRARERLK